MTPNQLFLWFFVLNIIQDNGFYKEIINIYMGGKFTKLERSVLNEYNKVANGDKVQLMKTCKRKRFYFFKKLSKLSPIPFFSSVLLQVLPDMKLMFDAVQRKKGLSTIDLFTENMMYMHIILTSTKQR